MAEDILRMSRKELMRLHVINRVLEGGLKQAEAGEILSVSPRQVRRIAKRVRIEGDAGIAHKLRGRAS
ncbi:MAG: helix-turn-helix domain-containing protein, partial [Deltaproteobacteria bacterium]|nr:helix-turn-helix domain-containing protein [Deltaproteobacteria bacterium]